MSDLYRSALSARINKLPQLPTVAPCANDEDDEEEANETDLLGALPSMPPPRAPGARSLSHRKKEPDPSLTPLSATGYFDQAVEVTVPSSQLVIRVYYTPPKVDNGTILVCHHGAGYSALSFACFAKEVTDTSGGDCGVLAFDARRHGKTVSTTGTDDDDLSIETLTQDLVNLLQVIFPDAKASPSLLLVGHSMGGSVVVRASSLLQGAKYRLCGVAVLDVVEGSAIEALPHMHNLLKSRPSGFDSPEEATEWHLSTHTIRNPLSARISVPSLIVPVDPSEGSESKYKWRTPLHTTAAYWEGWFTGLSKGFLAVRTARLLVLAGTDRLDKDLMIGQMQGKFQLVVIPDTGHMIHEDNPTRLAEIVVEFWKRNDRVIEGVKKVGEL